MTMKRFAAKAFAILSLSSSVGASIAEALPPAPKLEQFAAIQPKQTGVTVTTPTAAELARCRVVAYPDDKKPIGHAILDANNKPIRRFFAIGTENYNIFSFYLDGQEVYRETDTKSSGKVDQFRWLGALGSKQGADVDGDGSIDSWQIISPEEVSKEIFESLVSNDVRRLRTLMLSPPEMELLGLPIPEKEKLQARMGRVVARFEETVAKLKLTDKAKWVHAELWAPETTPFDAFNGKIDLVRHRNGGVLVDTGVSNTAATFQLGELVQIGRAWRIIDGPLPGSPDRNNSEADIAGVVPEAVKELVAELSAVKPPDASNRESVAKHHVARAEVLAKVVAKLQGDPRQDSWLRQLLEAYVAAGEYGDAKSAEQLNAWRTQIDKVAPKSPLAGFAAYRSLGLEYATRLAASDSNQTKVAELQKWWREQLDGFVATYPNIEETPEALYRLAMATEYSGAKDSETVSKGYYETLAKNFSTHPLGAQARGAVLRIDSEGKPFALSGPTLDGKGSVDVSKLTGQVVIVYYWGSFHSRLKEEAAALNELQKKHAASKKLSIVTVCLDQNPQQAAQAITATQLPGDHLFQQGGGLAAQYGIMGPHFFLIDKTGKVANKNTGFPMLNDEVEKLLK